MRDLFKAIMTGQVVAAAAMKIPPRTPPMPDPKPIADDPHLSALLREPVRVGGESDAACEIWSEDMQPPRPDLERVRHLIEIVRETSRARREQMDGVIDVLERRARAADPEVAVELVAAAIEILEKVA